MSLRTFLAVTFFILLTGAVAAGLIVLTQERETPNSDAVAIHPARTSTTRDSTYEVKGHTIDPKLYVRLTREEFEEYPAVAAMSDREILDAGFKLCGMVERQGGFA